MKERTKTYRETLEGRESTEREWHQPSSYSRECHISYHREISPPIFAQFSAWLRENLRNRALYPMDIYCLSYLKIMILLSIIFQNNLSNGITQTMNHSFILLGTYLILIFRKKYSQNNHLAWIGVAYPVAIIAFGWSSLSQMAPVIYGNYWTTSWVVQFDRLIFGIHPTVWCEQFYRPWLDECMNVFYSGYYLYMPMTVLFLLFNRKHKDLIYALSLASFTYLGCFVLYCIFPTLGPSMTPEIVELSKNSYTGYWISSITKWIQSGGSVVGAAFPSSHVAGSIIWTLIALKIKRPLGIFLALMTPGVALSTVYLGYHHALDSVTGIAWGFFCYKLVEPGCSYLLNHQHKKSL